MRESFISEKAERGKGSRLSGIWTSANRGVERFLPERWQAVGMNFALAIL
jgi:hypothetical protein